MVVVTVMVVTVMVVAMMVVAMFAVAVTVAVAGLAAKHRERGSREQAGGVMDRAEPSGGTETAKMHRFLLEDHSVISFPRAFYERNAKKELRGPRPRGTVRTQFWVGEFLGLGTEGN
ncbi:MAG: hypothetical protein AAF586_06810 [Planctomycetota bacterium]